MVTSRAILIALLLCAAAAFCCTGCGSSPSMQFSTDYRGFWDVVYNLVQTDEEEGSAPTCSFFIAPGILGFVDQQSVEDSEAGGLLFASVGGLLEAPARLEADGSLVAEDLFSGNLFGDGVFCDFRRSFSFSQLQNDAATAFFVQTVSCRDGFICEDRGIGRATRRR